MTTTAELATVVYTAPFVHKDDDMGSEVPMAEEPVIAPAPTREET